MVLVNSCGTGGTSLSHKKGFSVVQFCVKSHINWQIGWVWLSDIQAQFCSVSRTVHKCTVVPFFIVIYMCSDPCVITV